MEHGRSVTPDTPHVMRASLWNPAVGLDYSSGRLMSSSRDTVRRPNAVSSAPPPAAHQSPASLPAPGHIQYHLQHLNHTHLPSASPPPAHSATIQTQCDAQPAAVSALTRGYSSSSSSTSAISNIVHNKADQQSSFAPPHIYSTMGFQASRPNGQSSNQSSLKVKSSFISVDSLISKSSSPSSCLPCTSSSSSPSSSLNRGQVSSEQSKSRNSVAPLGRGPEKLQPVTSAHSAPVPSATATTTPAPAPGQWTTGKSSSQLFCPHPQMQHFAPIPPQTSAFSLPPTRASPSHSRGGQSSDRRRSKAQSFEPPENNLHNSTANRIQQLGSHQHPNAAAVAEVTFAHLFNERPTAHLPPYQHHHQHQPHTHPLQPRLMPLHMGQLQSQMHMTTTTSSLQHHSHQTSHQHVVSSHPHPMLHLPPDQRSHLIHATGYPHPVLVSSINDLSHPAVCDNNNCSPRSSRSTEIVRGTRVPEPLSDAIFATSSVRRDVTENTIEIPCSSVSPTNSTTSSSNSSSGGGGSKVLPKKMWIHKYNSDGPGSQQHLSPEKKTPDHVASENGLIHSHDNSSSSKSHSSQAQNSTNSGNNSNSPATAAAATATATAAVVTSKSKDGKEKVNGASKKKSLSGKKRLKSEAPAVAANATATDSDATDSDADHQQTNGRGKKKGTTSASVKGHKRCSSATSDYKEKRPKKGKAEKETPDAESSNNKELTPEKMNESGKGKKAGKNVVSGQKKENEDSDRTEDEHEDEQEKQEDVKSEGRGFGEAGSGKKKQKRGRKPTTGSKAAGKRSPSTSSIASSTNSVSKKEKSPKSKGSDNSSGSSSGNKSKKTKSNILCDSSIDKSGQPFLQNKSCSELTPKSSSLLPKCRECKMTPYQKIKKDVGPSIFCRFYQFRKLVYDKELKAAGFSEPMDAKEEDVRLWMPPSNTNDILKKSEAKFLIEFVGDHFCNLVEQEAKAFSVHMGSNSRIAWKAVVAGVREMCDVCETTLFNIHWVCSECGFVVCIDCYRSRKEEESAQAKENLSKQSNNNSNKSCNSNNGINQNIKSEKCTLSESCDTLTTCSSATLSPLHAIPHPPPTGRSHTRDKDRYDWLYCNSKQPHLQEKLMLTQIVSKTALWHVFERLHEVKRKLGSPCCCENESLVAVLQKKHRNCFENKSLKEKDLNGCNELQVVKTESEESTAAASSPLSVLADVAINSSDCKAELDQVKKEEVDKKDEDDKSALRDLLSNGSPSSKHLVDSVKGKVNNEQQNSCSQQQHTQSTTQKESDTTAAVSGKKRGKKLPPMLSTQLNGVIRNSDVEKSDTNLQYFHRRIIPIFTSKNTPPRASSLEESKKQFPDISHEWCCDGRLLILKDTGNDSKVYQQHLQLFEQQWLRHQPVVVCKVNDWLERHLWQPSVFKNKYSDTIFDLIESETGEVTRDQPLKKYWEGFENMKARPRDKNGRSLIFKLKDWPPGEEFSEALPEQYADLMSCIPMPDYTTHEGSRNLVGRLPRSFGLVPDLGPKMYTAYGLASDNKGTTNLHLDMSDAVNVMVYVGTFKSKDDEKEHQRNVMKALEEAEAEKSQLNRARKEKVGALWHIYDSRDADKIRDMLNCCALEQGRKLHLHQDPIHDQSFYLNADMRRHLKEKYSVVGYTVVQFYGDAVFIPAGAPHQVRNLSSCIKIATDFVSPENVAHCFNLTEEFRQLSQAHDNHEDKLQIKNIIYHAVKDALASFSDSVTS